MEIGTRGYCLTFVLLSGCRPSGPVGRRIERHGLDRQGGPSKYRSTLELFVCRTHLSQSGETVATSRVPQHIISTLTCPRSTTAHFGHSRPSFRLLSPSDVAGFPSCQHLYLVRISHLQPSGPDWALPQLVPDPSTRCGPMPQGGTSRPHTAKLSSVD